MYVIFLASLPLGDNVSVAIAVFPNSTVTAFNVADSTLTKIFSAITLFVSDTFPAASITQKYHVPFLPTLFDISIGPFVWSIFVQVVDDCVGTVDVCVSKYATTPVPISFTFTPVTICVFTSVSVVIIKLSTVGTLLSYFKVEVSIPLFNVLTTP